jgi:hypothetical protein
MRLIRKITYKRVSQLPQHKKVVSIFEKFKEDSDIDRHNALKRTKDHSTLNYFIVLEFDNIIKKKINIKNFIEKDPVTNKETVNINRLVEEKAKLEESIKERMKKEPAFFSKLGIINQVTGCYLVGANKKSVAHIRDLDLKSKNNFIIVKLDNRKLPKEIEEMCSQFYAKTQERIRKEQEEFERFSKMNQKEQDDYINNILNNIGNTNTPPPSVLVIDNINFNNDLLKPSGFTFFDGFSEKNVQQIENVQFLETLLANAEEKEQYEFCAKIRDRLIEIKTKKEL